MNMVEKPLSSLKPPSKRLFSPWWVNFSSHPSQRRGLEFGKKERKKKSMSELEQGTHWEWLSLESKLCWGPKMSGTGLICSFPIASPPPGRLVNILPSQICLFKRQARGTGRHPTEKERRGAALRLPQLFPAEEAQAKPPAFSLSLPLFPPPPCASLLSLSPPPKRSLSFH